MKNISEEVSAFIIECYNEGYSKKKTQKALLKQLGEEVDDVTISEFYSFLEYMSSGVKDGDQEIYESEQMNRLIKRAIRLTKENKALKRNINVLLEREEESDLYEAFVKEVCKQKYNSPKIKPKAFKSIKTEIKAGALCGIISDTHADEPIDDYFETAGAELYNFDVFQQRLMKYATKLIEIQKVEQREDLILFLLGDMISGDIHLESTIAAQYGIIENKLKTAEVLARLIEMVAPYFPGKIKVLTKPGNHGRLTQGYTYKTPENNYDNDIYITIKHLLETNAFNVPKGKVSVEVHPAFISYVKVGNLKIGITHGDQLKKYREINNGQLDAILLGHFHSFYVEKYMEDFKEVTLIQNGATCKVNGYARKGVGIFSKVNHQTVFMLNKDTEGNVRIGDVMPIDVTTNSEEYDTFGVKLGGVDMLGGSRFNYETNTIEIDFN